MFILLFIFYVIQFGHYDFSGWRYVHVRILVDNEYTNTKKDWATDIPAIIEKTSEFYEQRFKIKLIIVNWGRLITTQELADFKELALSNNNDGNEVLIGFTGRNIKTSDNENNADALSILSMILISGEHTTLKYQTDLLKHEIGHLFLAIHRKRTIMDPINNISDKNFDDLNKLIIKLNKYQNFQIGKFIYEIYLAYLKTASLKILI